MEILENKYTVRKLIAGKIKILEKKKMAEELQKILHTFKHLCVKMYV